MKKILFLLLALFVAVPLIAQAASMMWQAPTNYADNVATQIPAADQARIVYTPYYGPSATGPWTAGMTTAAGVTTVTLPDPGPGQTRWYTVDATLDGQTSAKGVAASKTVPFKVPAAPSGITVQ